MLIFFTYFFRNQGSVGNSNAGFRDMDFGGYPAASVYSTPSANFNTAYQREKQQFNNGVSGNIGGDGGGGTPSNTVIVANVRDYQLFIDEIIWNNRVLFYSDSVAANLHVRYLNLQVIRIGHLTEAIVLFILS